MPPQETRIVPSLIVVKFAAPPLKTRIPPPLIVVKFATPPLKTCIPPTLMIVEFAVVPECKVADAYDNTKPLKLLETKVTCAPDATSTYPPFSLIANAVPPLET